MCVGFCFTLFLHRTLRNLVRESVWQSTLPRARCLGKHLGYIRRLLVCVANRSYSSLNDRVEPSNIFHSSLGLSGLKPVILLSTKSCC